MNIPKGKIIEGNITKHMDRRFLSSLDLIGAGEVTLTIDRVELVERLEYLNGNTETNAKLLYFTETEKPLTLCVTNIKALIRICGNTKAKEWHGKRVVVVAKKVKAFGRLVDAVRIIGADEGGKIVYDEDPAERLNKRLKK